MPLYIYEAYVYFITITNFQPHWLHQSHFIHFIDLSRITIANWRWHLLVGVIGHKPRVILDRKKVSFYVNIYHCITFAKNVSIHEMDWRWTGFFLMNLEVKPFKIINDGIWKCNWKQFWLYLGYWMYGNEFNEWE